MKYLYKHGNQFWYQRAVPLSLQEVIGLKSIKVSLKTNKIAIAIKRSKLQALEHKKMFNEYSEKKGYLSTILKKKINLKVYQLSFIDDYDDLISQIIFSKKQIFNNVKKKIDTSKTHSLENFLFNLKDEELLLSKFFNNFLKTNKLDLYKEYYQSVNFLLESCGDKLIYDYNSEDYEIIKSSNKQYISQLKNFFLFCNKNFDLNKKIRFKKKITSSNLSKRTDEYSNVELMRIIKFCKENLNFNSLLILLLIDSGCTFEEIVGISSEDIYMDNYMPFIIIRSNKRRIIKNVNKLRTVPLLGNTLWSMQKINENKLNKKKFLSLTIKDRVNLKADINKTLKKIVYYKTLISFKKTMVSRLIKINCPERVILDIIGNSKKNRLYNEEISLEVKASWLEQITNL